MKAQLRNSVAALLLLMPAAAAFVATPAVAQQRAVASPRVVALSLNSDNGLAPGAVLRVSMRGTAKGRASVSFGGTDITVPLRERAAGQYSGSYTVRRADHIDPTLLMTARLTRANRTAVQTFHYPPSFQALAMGAAPAPVNAPRIDRFAAVPVGRIAPGRELHFRLEGAPGGAATFDIPGVASDIAMRETRPGQYEGTYTVRRRDDPEAFTAAIATLRFGNRFVTARTERFVRDDVADRGRRDRDDERQGRWSRDEIAPRIDDLEPRHGERVDSTGRTTIGAAFEDAGGSGIDPESVRILLAGRNVTAAARITEDGFRYREDLPPGRYTAEVTARDRAGNATTKAWTFDVGGGFSVGPGTGGPLAVHVSSPGNNATIDADGTVVIRGRTSPWAEVRVDVDAVSPMLGNVIGVTQQVLNQSVRADGDGRFSVTVPPRAGLLPGSRYEVTLTAQQGSQTAESRLTLYPRG